MAVENIDAEDRGDAARAYLAHARRCADLVNAWEMPRIGQNSDPLKIAQIGIMNALLAIAVMQIPDDPGKRLA